MFDIKKVAGNFHRHAAEYDLHSSVQKRVVVRLSEIVSSHLDAVPRTFLDIGCGTGALTAYLAKMYPASTPFGIDIAFNMALSASVKMRGSSVIINADAENLPFRESSFDLVASASTLQWVNDLQRCVSECFRALKPGGCLSVAFFGGKTLHELQESYLHAVEKYFGQNDPRVSRLHDFRKIGEIERLFNSSRFSKAIVFSETEIDYQNDMAGLLRSIKKTGAGTPNIGGRGNGLGWRGILCEAEKYYLKHYLSDGKLPVTYEVFYIVARK